MGVLFSVPGTSLLPHLFFPFFFSLVILVSSLQRIHYPTGWKWKSGRERERGRGSVSQVDVYFSYTTSSSLLIALLPTYLLFSVVVMRFLVNCRLSSATPTRLVSNPASVPDSDVVMLEICAIMAA